MADAGVTPPTMECGFCLQTGSALVDPKVLPCSHTHCLGCLIVYFELQHVIRCPKCSEVYDITLDSLPTASLVGDNSLCCDTCKRKGVNDQPAETYCMTCSKKFCAKHREYHDEVHDDHPKIGISEYRTQARKLEVRTCTVHGVALTLGCRTCFTVICVDCVPRLGICGDGRNHELTSLSDLAGSLVKEIYELKAEVIDREATLEGIFKKTSENIEDHEIETREMIERIHQKRDEQIEAITAKYATLENKLLNLRTECKSAMAKFMEGDVGVRLSDLSKHRLRIEARVKHSHQVDIITEYKNTKDGLQKLLNEALPEFDSGKTWKLGAEDESRDIELKVFSADSADDQMGADQSKSKHIPKLLKWLKTLQTSEYAKSVYHYQGTTYVAQSDNVVSRIDGDFQMVKPFLTFNNPVADVKVYKDRVYTLVHGSSYKFNVHDLAGQLITSWEHTDSDTYFNMFAIVSDQIVALDRINKRLTLYDLTGKTLKHIPCPQISKRDDDLSICAVNHDAVIVSIYDTDQVFRLKLSSGEVVWSSSQINKPRGVFCYGQTWVLVASSCCDKIQILDVRTAQREESTVGQQQSMQLWCKRLYGRRFESYQLTSEECRPRSV